MITYRLSRRSTAPDVAIDAVDALPPRRGMTPDARRDEAISRGLAKRLEQLAAERERRERAAEKADAEFSNEFLNARSRRPNPLRSATRRRARILRARRLKRAVARGDIDASPTAPLAGRARGISNDRRRRVGHAREA